MKRSDRKMAYSLMEPITKKAHAILMQHAIGTLVPSAIGQVMMPVEDTVGGGVLTCHDGLKLIENTGIAERWAEHED